MKKICRVWTVLLGLFILIMPWKVQAQEQESGNAEAYYNIVVVVVEDQEKAEVLGTKEDIQHICQVFLELFSEKNATVKVLGYDGNKAESLTIGKGLSQALDYLKGPHSNSSVPGCVLLLSNQGFESEEGWQEKEQAIKEAKYLNIPIHGFCLNTDPESEMTEIQEIAEATDGFYHELRQIEEENIEILKFYSNIYGMTLVEGEVADTEEKEFFVPSYGVADVHIALEGDLENWQIFLTDPNGNRVSLEELQESAGYMGDIQILQMSDPVSGTWILQAEESEEGSGEESLWVYWIYHMSLDAKIGCQEEEIVLGEPVAVTGQLYAQDALITDSKVYEAYTATLILKNAVTGESQKYPMELQGDAYESVVEFEEYATYDASVILESGGIWTQSEISVLNVGNQPPELTTSLVEKKKVAVFPGSVTVEFPLEEYVTDPEGEGVSYDIKTYSYDSGDVTIEDGVLSIVTGAETKGTVEVLITDSYGASVMMTFEVTVYRMWIGILIVILLAILYFAGRTVYRIRRKSK